MIDSNIAAQFIGISVSMVNNKPKNYVLYSDGRAGKGHFKYVPLLSVTSLKQLLTLRNKFWDEHGWIEKGMLKLLSTSEKECVKNVFYRTNTKHRGKPEPSFCITIRNLQTRNWIHSPTFLCSFKHDRVKAKKEAIRRLIKFRTEYNEIANEYNILYKMWWLKTAKREIQLGQPLLSYDFQPMLWQQALSNVQKEKAA